jgi:DNA-binding NarL/FixJ family response regulator
MLLYALCGIVALSSHEIIGLAPRIVKRFSKQAPDLPVVSNTGPAQDERSYSHVHSYLTHVLTERELSISIALAQGKTTHQIAQHYHISDSTVRTHKQRVLNKLRANSDDQLIRLVHDSGLLEPSDSDIS